MRKAIVAYFSCGGRTKELAETLASALGVETFRIEPAVPYTTDDLDWNNKESRTSREMNDPASRPAIAGRCAALADCDVVFLGFPLWWYFAPTIINTFLEAHDFSGKTVVPFLTSNGSGVGETDSHLRGSCPNAAKWLPTVRLDAEADEEDLREWADGLGL